MQVQPTCFSKAAAPKRSSFIASALGAEVQMVMRFSDSPDQ